MKLGALHIDQRFINLQGQAIWRILKQCHEQHPVDGLYVFLRPSNPLARITSSVFDGISQVYNQAFRVNANTDVRLFLANLKHSGANTSNNPAQARHGNIGRNQSINRSPIALDVLFSDRPSSSLPGGICHVSPSTTLVNVDFSGETQTDSPLDTKEEAWKTYDHVVIGGTFDHLHAGHKLLLSNAILRCNKRLTIGLTTQDMLKKKRLADLIPPIEQRQRVLHEFCTEVDSSVEYNIVPLTDPFGPSVVYPELEAIVASEETLDGANTVNVERQKKNLSLLDVHTFPVNDVEGSTADLRTISSSWYRQQMLGRLIRTPKVRPNRKPGSSYLIGLTGGSGSGKSRIGEYLANKAAAMVIDCDKIAHESYRKGTLLHGKLTTEYGENIVDLSTGEIARKELGRIVFSSQDARQKLNELIWPEVMKYCLEKISLIQPKVAFIDAALLIEAGWCDSLDETWVAFVPEEEAVRRIVQRDAVSEEYAKARIASQMSNSERIQHANVIFCSLWDYSVTRAQVDKAWHELLQRIN